MGFSSLNTLEVAWEMAVHARPAEKNDWTALRRALDTLSSAAPGPSRLRWPPPQPQRARAQPAIFGNLALDAPQDDILINYAGGPRTPT